MSHPFPYKRNRIDPEQLWTNAVSQNFVIVKRIAQEQTKSWDRLPRLNMKQLSWTYRGHPLVMIIPQNMYDKVTMLTDYFSEEARIKDHPPGHPSPYDYFQQHYDELVVKAKILQGDDNTLPFEHYLREAIYRSTKERPVFKISLCKAIYIFFNSKKVLDASPEWGDRLLGAAAANVHTYHGYCTNPLINWSEIINFVKEYGNYNYSISNKDFLQSNIPCESYDTVFTTPPTKNINGNLFMLYFNKIWTALQYGGHLILYIRNATTMPYIEKLLSYITNKLSGKFCGVIAVTNHDMAFANPLWVWRKV